MSVIKKHYKDGLKFDSRLELFFYNLLKKEKIEFNFQHKYILFPSFKYDGKSIRPMTLTVDFDFTSFGKNIIVDTKGFQRNDNILKWKIFKYNMATKLNMQPTIYFPKNQAECLKVVETIKSS